MTTTTTETLKEFQDRLETEHKAITNQEEKNKFIYNNIIKELEKAKKANGWDNQKIHFRRAQWLTFLGFGCLENYEAYLESIL